MAGLPDDCDIFQEKMKVIADQMVSNLLMALFSNIPEQTPIDCNTHTITKIISHNARTIKHADSLLYLFQCFSHDTMTEITFVDAQRCPSFILAKKTKNKNVIFGELSALGQQDKQNKNAITTLAVSLLNIQKQKKLQGKKLDLYTSDALRKTVEFTIAMKSDQLPKYIGSTYNSIKIYNRTTDQLNHLTTAGNDSFHVINLNRLFNIYEPIFYEKIGPLYSSTNIHGKKCAQVIDKYILTFLMEIEKLNEMYFNIPAEKQQIKTLEQLCSPNYTVKIITRIHERQTNIELNPIKYVYVGVFQHTNGKLIYFVVNGQYFNSVYEVVKTVLDLLTCDVLRPYPPSSQVNYVSNDARCSKSNKLTIGTLFDILNVISQLNIFDTQISMLDIMF